MVDSLNLRVRAIRCDDVAAAAELVREGSLNPESEDPGNVDAYWAAVQEMRMHRGDVLVAEREREGEGEGEGEGEVVGVCQVIVFPHFQHTGGWCCELESVHVRSDLRSRGIGAALLRAAEDLARSQNCYRVQLTSRNVRHDAHRFYLANGYEQTSQGFKKWLE